MSDVYALEPATKGKVILQTTLGPLDIDLWAKEVPKACRNFVQLCMEGYYDDTIFHRVIPGFLIQGGDPEGDGSGGDSIYDDDATPFPNEYHSRLKFRYRGMVGLATSERDGRSVNGSQFFITLDRADGLNGKHTLFGRVTGATIWNVARMAESDIDANDRPLEPPKILSCEVIWNPFPDIVPRIIKRILGSAEDNLPPKDAGVQEKRAGDRPFLKSRRQALVSFDDFAPSDSALAFQVASAHDVLQSDPSLSRAPAPYPDAEAAAKVDRIKAKVIAKQNQLQSSPQDNAAPPVEVQADVVDEPTIQVADDYTVKDGEIEAYAIKTKGVGTSARLEMEANSLQDSDLLSERERRRQLQKAQRQSSSRKVRAADGLKKLTDFQTRLRKLTATTVKENSTISSAQEEGDLEKNWLPEGGLKFAVDSSTAYAYDAAHEALAVFDPLSSKDGAAIARKRKRDRESSSFFLTQEKLRPRDLEPW